MCMQCNQMQCDANACMRIVHTLAHACMHPPMQHSCQELRLCALITYMLTITSALCTQQLCAAPAEPRGGRAVLNAERCCRFMDARACFAVYSSCGMYVLCM